MKIGVSVTSHHGGLAPAEALRTVLERVRAAADAGLDHLTFGDHHAVGPDGLYLQGVPLLARALAEWPADRQAGLLFLVPLWHPVLMAEHIGTLAAMTDAPLIVQTGIGHGQKAFDAMGASLRTRGRETDRRIRMVQALLAGDSVSDADLGITNAAIGPRPQAPVHWWIGSGPAAAPLQRAAGLGDALYVSPGATIDALRSLSADYRERCQAIGRPSRIVLRRDVYLHPDRDEAVRVVDELQQRGYRGMRREVLVAGDPASVAAAFAACGDAGADEIAARVVAVPQAGALTTIELLGEVRARLA